jgi:hypothetical protein
MGKWADMRARAAEKRKAAMHAPDGTLVLQRGLGGTVEFNGRVLTVNHAMGRRTAIPVTRMASVDFRPVSGRLTITTVDGNTETIDRNPVLRQADLQELADALVDAQGRLS